MCAARRGISDHGLRALADPSWRRLPSLLTVEGGRAGGHGSKTRVGAPAARKRGCLDAKFPRKSCKTKIEADAPRTDQERFAATGVASRPPKRRSVDPGWPVRGRRGFLGFDHLPMSFQNSRTRTPPLCHCAKPLGFLAPWHIRGLCRWHSNGTHGTRPLALLSQGIECAIALVAHRVNPRQFGAPSTSLVPMAHFGRPSVRYNSPLK